MLRPLPPELLTLFAGVFAALLVASLAGRALKRLVAQGQPHATIDNLNARVNAWWVMIAVLGVAFAFDKAGVVVLFGFASFVALREFVSQAGARRAGAQGRALAFLVVLPLQYLLVGYGWYGLYATLIPVYALLVLPLFGAAPAAATRRFDGAAGMPLALLTCVYGLSYVPALMGLRIAGFEDANLLLIAWLLFVVQSSDVLQYLWGKTLGRRRVAPALSPSKTVEGLVGGVASAIVLGTALHGLTPFTPWQAAAMALVVTLLGYLGGLVLSASKRELGVKDWGTLIDGHGGMLDRLDSLVLAAPVYYHLLRWFWEP